ncbi:MAG: hypothetical protein ACYTX0_38400 [Nostoc sp.]
MATPAAGIALNHQKQNPTARDALRDENWGYEEMESHHIASVQNRNQSAGQFYR